MRWILSIFVLFPCSFSQNITIPDAIFKVYLVANFDTNADGEISQAEAEAVMDGLSFSGLGSIPLIVLPEHHLQKV